MRCSGVERRDTITATVASISDASTKKCHGRKPASSACTSTSASTRILRALVEVAELIVQPRLQRAVRGNRRGLGVRVGLAPRPPNGHECDSEGSSQADRVGKEPGKPVETLVHGNRKDVLAAELL